MEDVLGGLDTQTTSGSGGVWGFLGGIVGLGAPIASAWAQGQVTKDDRAQQAKVETAKSNTTMWIVGGVAAVIAILGFIWVVKRK